ncbi:HAD family hydrolase [Methylosoma difficile]
MQTSYFYALDFDGVICDSAIETGITGWKAASQLWADMPKQAPTAIIDAFRQARPVIETGYEAILTVRLLFLGETVEAICRNSNEYFAKLMAKHEITTEQLKGLFGEVRDAWIADNLNDWIAMNPLFDGVADKLRKLGAHSPWMVVTTKQERFVKHILSANGLMLADEAIYGLDRKLSKAQVLEGLLLQHPDKTCVFVEDRLPTLLTIKTTPALTNVNLQFALWGYNTDEDKLQAVQNNLQCVSLDDFLQIN